MTYKFEGDGIMEKSINEKTIECLNCKSKPCTKGCPLGNNMPEVINLINQNKIEEAYRELEKTTLLPAICGRICPHMSQCMGKCIKGIKGEPVLIGQIETFIGDNAIKNKWIFKKGEQKNKKIAIIGSGPAGLTCAGFLAIKGYDVTIYEKNTELGGLLRYGIPEFRLDREKLKQSINRILELGIKVKCSFELGKNLDMNELESMYDGIFIAIGANIPWKMEIEGEDLEGVYGGNTLLYKLENGEIIPDFKNKSVAIIGGGNVAMDCARTIKKLGAGNVKVIYRREREQMPAEQNEIEDAIEEGIEFLFKNNIVKIIGSKKVEKIECIKTELIKKQDDDRLTPINIDNSNYVLDIDYIVMAIGSQTEKETLIKSNLELDKYGYIKVDENFKTSNKKVWAGGDVIGSKATVAWASYFGRTVAENIDKSF